VQVEGQSQRDSANEYHATAAITTAIGATPGRGRARDLPRRERRYTPAFYHTEQALAHRLATLLKTSVEVDMPRVGRWIDGYTQKKGITLSAAQRQAVELAAASRLLILTGGPGCGKTGV
jgi:ATP-dependent exoDNAse (exonuclease V) alpha subunit